MTPEMTPHERALMDRSLALGEAVTRFLHEHHGLTPAGADLVAVGMVDHVTVAQCEGCHNTDSPFVGPDYVFDYEAKKDTGTHEKFPLKYQH